MSSALDDDTLATVAKGRETAFTVLGSAKKHLQKAFIAFVLGMVGTIFALRVYVWDFLRANTRSQMPPAVTEQTDIIARNPFDVILIQVKIGLFVGIVLALPIALYYSRDALRARGLTAKVPISRTQQALFGFLAAVLFLGGLLYAYAVFFPVMFNFLATNAIQAAVKPSYDIVMYVQFMLLLTVSFGLAAQLPLFMSVLSYAEIVPYETFRDKWKYAVILIFTFGAFFSPPDPFTQIMWAIPLCSLYLFSLGLSKLVTNVRRGGEDGAQTLTIRRGVYGMAALFVLATVGGYLLATRGGLAYLNANLLPAIPAGVRPGPLTVAGLIGFEGTVGTVLFSLATGVVTVVAVVFALVLWVLNQPVVPRGGPSEHEDPEDLDVSELTAEGVRAAPPELFLAMDEDEAVAHAGTALDDGNDQKAQAILDRFDEVDENREKYEQTAAEEIGEQPFDEDEIPDTDGETPDQWPPEDDEVADAEDEGGLLTGTAASMADAFTEEETTEDDIGGYFYDITFIIQSITSKAFRIVGVFMATLGIVFYWLYQGGLGTIKSSFFSQVDPELLRQAAGAVRPLVVERTRDATSVVAGAASGPAVAPPPAGGNPSPNAANYIIALHPVEQLIFEVKVSTIVGAVVAMPVLLYYAWPAIQERGFSVGGDRRVFLVWGGTLIGGMVAGSLVGFFFIAPNIISWFVADTLRAGYVISYRLNVFMWMIIATTLGIGLLADVPLTMLLFDRGGIVSFERMFQGWRVVVVVVFAIAGLVIPGGVLTMFIIAIPVCFAYGVGLALLWVVTLPRRLRGGPGPGEGGEEEASVV